MKKATKRNKPTAVFNASQIKAYIILKVPQQSTPVYPTRSCACICIPKSKCMYGYISFGSIIRRLHGNRKSRPEQTARQGCLCASPLGFLHAATKATRRGRRCVRYPLLTVLPILVTHAQVSHPATTKMQNYGIHKRRSQHNAKVIPTIINLSLIHI